MSQIASQVQRSDGSWHPAEVIHRRRNDHNSDHEYYVHYDGFDRRLDEWIKKDRIRAIEGGEVKPSQIFSGLLCLSAFSHEKLDRTRTSFSAKVFLPLDCDGVA